MGGVFAALRVVANGVDVDGVIVGAGEVVVKAVLVGSRGDDGDVIVIRVINRPLGQRRVRDRPQRLLNDGGTQVHCIRCSHREAIGIGNKAVANPQRGDAAARTDASIVDAVVGLRSGVGGFTCAVTIARVVIRIVVVVKEVPARDVVDVAVAVVVFAI